MSVKPAAPRYAIGDVVSYTDHHVRIQKGEVMIIEARWSKRCIPFVSYTVGHPTYANRRMCVGEEDIIGLVNDCARIQGGQHGE